MDKFKITLKNIQHIKNLEYKIDLSKNTLHCLVGKNGIGKTTLIKVIQNFKETNALDKLSRLNIIQNNSEVIYTVDDTEYKFTSINDDGRHILNTTDIANQEDKNSIYTELPIPIGKRFNEFERLGGNIGDEIKSIFSLGNYAYKPTELIDILNRIYDSDDRFNELEQINIKEKSYYIKPISDENYIREDDFSSGEYMLIQIYKLIKTGCKLIVIDELDISLDSSAQINLIKELKSLATQYGINILFTTHSLAIMKMMEDEELFYMEEIDNKILIKNKSYNYIKSLLFQFEGFDKCILTEDEMLQNYMEYILKDESIFHKFKIIYIGGAGNVIDIMDRNKIKFFFGESTDVISILDGDKKNISNYNERHDIDFLPFDSIEQELYLLYASGFLNYYIKDIKKVKDVKFAKKTNKGKVLRKALIKNNYMSNLEIFNLVNTNMTINHKKEKIDTFKEELLYFLN